MSSHTPGPWLYVEDYGSRVVADGHGFSAPYRSTPGSGQCLRQNADNRLIASAPELLDQLRRAASILADVAGDIEDGGSLDSLRGKYVSALVNARDDALAVIKKASP